MWYNYLFSSFKIYSLVENIVHKNEIIELNAKVILIQYTIFYNITLDLPSLTFLESEFLTKSAVLKDLRFCGANMVWSQPISSPGTALSIVWFQPISSCCGLSTVLNPDVKSANLKKNNWRLKLYINLPWFRY